MKNIIILSLLATCLVSYGQPTLANSDDIIAAKARANHTGTQAWSTLTATPTTLSGYGITDARPLNAGIVVVNSNGIETSYPFAANTAAERWNSFNTANSALTSNAGQIVKCPPGDYLHPGTSINLVSGTTYEFGNARFYLGANASSNVYLINAPNSSTDVKILGGIFDSNGYTISSGYGWIQGNVTRKLTIIGSRFNNTILGWAITTQGTPSPKYPGSIIKDCSFYNSSGIQVLSEFCEISNCHFTTGLTSSVRGIALYAGNATFNQCYFTGLAGGIVVDCINYSNDSHSVFNGCIFAHNTVEIIKIRDSVDNGIILNGCQIYGESSTQGWLDLAGGGFLMNGGTLDCLVKAATNPSGNHYFNKVLRPSASLVVTDAQLVANLDATKNAKIVFDMQRLDGPFPYNDPPQPTLASYTDDAAAAADTALLSGSLYKITGSTAIHQKP